jgi:HSP20 family protein
MPQTPREFRESLQREVERLFHDLIYRRHPASHFAEPAWSPLTDLVVSKHGARVLIELAGVPRETVRVRLHGSALEVSGRRSPPQEPVGAHYHRAEIYFGDFRRVVELPWEADPNRVQAVYKDGMLEIHLRPLTPKRVAVTIETSPEAVKVAQDDGGP